jgi:hypothetical protein
MSEFAGIGKVIKRDPQAHVTDPRGVLETWSNGLTKLEYFAAVAMQGLLLKLGSIVTPSGEDTVTITPDFLGLASGAVEMADALIKELEKDK